MKSALEKWQATVVVLAAITALTVLAMTGHADSVVVGAIGAVPTLVLGAGAVAHGVSQGSKASSDPPADS